MKRCPQCHRTYADDTLRFCLDDGVPLTATVQTDPGQRDPETKRVDPPPTMVLPSSRNIPKPGERRSLPLFVYILGPFLIAVILVLMLVGAIVLVWLKSGSVNENGSGSPSPYSRRSGGTESNRTPTPTPTSGLYSNPLARQLFGTWTWNSFVATYAPDGTGTYKNGSDLCFNFKYEVTGGVLHMVVVGKQQCGPSGLDYRISINGDDLRQEYTGNGYVTNWKRVK
jgi:hypothetical protein